MPIALLSILIVYDWHAAIRAVWIVFGVRKLCTAVGTLDMESLFAEGNVVVENYPVAITLVADEVAFGKANIEHTTDLLVVECKLGR